MNWIFGVIATAIFLGVGWGWFYFLKGHALPPATEIREISIVYSENIGDLLPDDYDPKEFVLKNVEEISRVLENLEGIPISRIPLIDSDNTDDGPNWILNIYYENGEFRFVTVDKEHVSGQVIKNSELYQYLKGHYT
ncbi:MAG: hypothetical protein QNJ07_17160 [Woeseiaceae bacterium]|nr:hypothetical protein [Woeseiaceae bacterium]